MSTSDIITMNLMTGHFVVLNINHYHSFIALFFFSDYVEFTPYEIGMPKFGAFVKPQDFGSKYYLGRIIDQCDETPLCYLMGKYIKYDLI